MRRVLASASALLSLVGAATASAAPAGRDPQGLYVDGTGVLQPSDPANLGSPSVVVDGASGNLLVHEIDDPIGTVPSDGSAPVWSLDRWYNSSQAASNRDIGKGWSTGLGYDVRLSVPDANTVVLFGPSQFAVTFTRQGDGSFTSSSPDYSISASGGGYVVSVTTQGRTLTFDGQGQLTNAATDTNAIRFDYTNAGGQTRLSAVYDSSSRATRFSYNGSGAIIEADNPASQHGYYHYSGASLNDASAPGGATTTYGYDSSGRLASLDRGTRHVVIGYDTQGRVSNLQDGSSQIALSYHAPTPPACDPTIAASQTDVTEPNGTIASYCFDADGHPVAASVPDHAAPALSLSDADAAYSASESKTLLEWASAADPDLIDGNPSEGIGGYNVRYRRGGGAWSDWTTTDLPRLIIDGGQVGESIDLEVSAFDGSGNTGAVQSATVSSVAYNSDVSLACSPTDDGLPADCNDLADDEPDGGQPATLTLERQPNSAAPNSAAPNTATGLARYRITVAGVWTTARLRPGSFVVGNVRDGWTLDRVGESIKGYYFGTIRGDYQGCGWVLASLLGGKSYANNGTSNCDNQGNSLPHLSTIAFEVSPLRTDGSPTRLKTNQVNGVRFCAYLTPSVDNVRRQHGCSSASKVVTYNQLRDGYSLKWRYVVRGGNWVLVRDSDHHSIGYGTVNWWFVRRSAFGRLCKRYTTPFTGVEQACSAP